MKLSLTNRSIGLILLPKGRRKTKPPSRPVINLQTRRFPERKPVDRAGSVRKRRNTARPIPIRNWSRSRTQRSTPDTRPPHRILCVLRRLGGHGEGSNTRSHPELGRENPQRRWYCVLRRGRVGRRQVFQVRKGQTQKSETTGSPKGIRQIRQDPKKIRQIRQDPQKASVGHNHATSPANQTTPTRQTRGGAAR